MIATLSPCTAPEQEPIVTKHTATSHRLLVYLAGPYTEPDPVENTHCMIRIADALLDAGFTPLIPHLTLAWHLVSPKRYETWLDYDRELLAHCDVVLRVPGRRGRMVRYGSNSSWNVPLDSPRGDTIRPCRSNGATRETQYADEIGIPVIRPRSADPADCVAAMTQHALN